MPRQLTSADLRRLADDLDKEELEEASTATKAQLEELLSREHLSAEELTRIREFFAELDKPEDEEEKPPPPEEEEAPPPPPPPPPPEDEEEEKPKARTRPGRKNGHAYDWEPDAETGEPVRLGFARVWSGEDEPDTVELAPLPAEEEEEQVAA